MTGNVSLDISIEGLWNSWRRFSAGKRRTCELDSFSYRIEQELFLLEQELKDETYHHGEYRTFVVSDCKKRTISVASIRDRVVHRLLYDYLVRCFDHTFIYDAWSCRRGKGLADAIDRAQKFARSFANGFVWRSDVRKFFDTVSHDVLLSLLTRRVGDPVALSLAHEIISSCRVPKASGGG